MLNSHVLIAMPFLFLFILQESSPTKVTHKDIVMERKLHGSGFHRDIRTVLTVPPGIRFEHASPTCGFLLFETLPSGVYADPFQVQSLVPFGGPQVLFDREVNIEAAEFLSRPHELYLFLSLNEQEITKGDSEMSVSLPVHARYHKPSTDITVSHATVTILYPGLYSNCSANSGAANTLSAPCDLSKTSVCNWVSLPYMNKSPVIKFHVPVGQEKDKPVVVMVTLVVSVTVCAVLIKVMWRAPHHDKSS